MNEFWFNFIYITLFVILILVCAFMILLVLMQRSKQEGIGAAFGSETTQSVFGAQTSNVLSKMTVYCAVLFFILTLTLSTMTSVQARATAGDRLAEKPFIPPSDDAFSMENFEEAFSTYLRASGILPPDEVAAAEQALDDRNWQDIPIPAADTSTTEQTTPAAEQADSPKDENPPDEPEPSPLPTPEPLPTDPLLQE